MKYGGSRNPLSTDVKKGDQGEEGGKKKPPRLKALESRWPTEHRRMSQNQESNAPTERGVGRACIVEALLTSNKFMSKIVVSIVLVVLSAWA